MTCIYLFPVSIRPTAQQLPLKKNDYPRNRLPIIKGKQVLRRKIGKEAFWNHFRHQIIERKIMKKTVQRYLGMLALLFLMFAVKANAQSLSLIPNPNANPGIQSVFNSPVVFGDNLYFSYTNSSSNVQLGKYDGTNVTLIANPDAGNGLANDFFGDMIVYNNNLYFQYQNVNGKYQLAKYDGTSITLINNPDNGFGFLGEAVVFNNNLYFEYENSNYVDQLAKFDGTSITLISNPDNGRGVECGSSQYNNPIVYGNNLYFQYTNSNFKSQLAKFDGNNISLISSPSTSYSYVGFPVVYNNNLYVEYNQPLNFGLSSQTNLAKYDGTNLTLIANPDNGTGYGLSSAETEIYATQPIVYNNKLYCLYNNASYSTQLIAYDGSTSTLIPNPNSNSIPAGQNLVVYNNNLYFTINGTDGNSTLAKYNGTSSTAIANTTAGSISTYTSIVFNGSLYLVTSNGDIQKLTKYDGTSFSVISNPTSLPSLLTYPIIFNNNLFLTYTNSTSLISQLAEYVQTPNPIITSFTPTTAPVGATVTISGSGFTGTTGVSIGGVPITNYTVVGYNTISVVLPTGAKSGSIIVTNPYGSDTATGFNICTGAVTPSVTIAVTNNNASSTICSGGSLSFAATPTNGGSSPVYQWMVNGSSVGSSTSTYSYKPADGDKVSLALTANNTCQTNAIDTSNTIITTLLSLPTVTISGTANGGCAPITRTANGGVSYSWSGGNTPTTATNSFTANGYYTVTVTNASGCSASATTDSLIMIQPATATSATAVSPLTCNTLGSVKLSGVTSSLIPADTLIYNSLAALPTGATTGIAGSGGYSNGTSFTTVGGRSAFELTPTSNSKSGYIAFAKTTIQPNGFNANFNIYIGGGSGADGLSFNYGKLNTGLSSAPETGILDSGLAVGFDEYNKVITIYYNQTSLTSYSTSSLNNSTWDTCRLTVTEGGLLNLSWGTTTIFTNYQLPSSYVTASKTNWQYAFAGRNGGSNDIHAVSSVLITDNAGLEYSANGVWSANADSTITGLTPGTYAVSIRTGNGQEVCPATSVGSVTITGANPGIAATVTANNPVSCGTLGSIAISNISSTINDTIYSTALTSASPATGAIYGGNNVKYTSSGFQLTNNTNSTSGYIYFPISRYNPNAITATFTLSQYGGSGADQAGFNYGVINTSGGVTKGLNIQFDEYKNVIYLYYNNSLIGTSGSTNVKQSNMACKVVITDSGKLTVYVNNTSVYTYNLATTTYLTDNKTSWNYGFSASCGGSNDYHVVSNFAVVDNSTYQYSYNGGTKWTTNADTTLPSSSTSYAVLARLGSVSNSCIADTLKSLSFAFSSDTTASSIDRVFTWHGSTYTQNGTYSYTTTTKTGGCDSTINLHLSFVAPGGFSYSTPDTFKVDTTITALYPTKLSVTSSSLGNNEFSYPAGLAVDVNGNVYVADNGNNAVKKIATDGKTVTILGSGFLNPSGVALDAAGNVYVADYGNNAVKKIATDGETVTTISSGFEPSGIAIDASGNIYVEAYYNISNALIKKIAVGVGTVTTIDTVDYAADGLAIDAIGNLYLSFEYGTTIEKLGVPGTPETYTISPALPTGLSINATTGVISGTPTVASAATNYTVTASNAGGSTSTTLSVTVKVLCVDTTVNITVVSDSASYTWHGTTYTQGGSYTYKTTTAIGGCDSTTVLNLSFAAPGQFSYNTQDTFKVGTPINSLLPTFIGVTTYTSGFNEPRGVASDALGNIYVADFGNNAVKKIAPNGNVTSLGSGFNYPCGVAVDAAGNVYVADYGNNAVKKIGTDGNITSITGFSRPSGIALDKAGNIYVAEYNSYLKKVAAGGNSVSSIAPNITGYSSVAVDASGNAYLANVNNGNIIKITSNGTVSNIASLGSNSFAWGIAVDNKSNLYVAAEGYSAIYKIAPNGDTSTYYSTNISADAVSVDSTGNLYIGNTFWNNVVKVPAPSGTPTNYSINPSLPTGLSINASTGAINGTPTVASAATNYTVTASNAGGSTSTILNITVLSSCTNTTSTITKSACGSYAWHGITYNTSGTYTFDSLNAGGCDSLTTLHLTINQPTTSTTTHTACSSYIWNGTTYTSSGSYTFSTTNKAGCDSTATLNLTINQPTTFTTTHSACSSYTWNGTTYTSSGTYTFSTTNKAGCDSTATLNLTINQPTTSTTTKTAVGSYTWNGTTYSASGTYTYVITNAKGCDSTATLILTIAATLPDYTWTGALNTDWSVAGNWTNNKLPISTTSVIIPASLPNEPVLSQDVTIAGIEIEGSVSLNGHSFTINDAMTGNGKLVGSTTSSLTIGGTAGTIIFDASSNSLKNLTIIGSVTLGNALNLYGTLTSTSGTLNTNGNLTLKSTSTNTAVVSQVSGNITGAVTIERFIPKGYAAFRDLGVAASNVGSIANTWGNSLNDYGVYNYNSGWSSKLPNATVLRPYIGYRVLVTGYKNPIPPPTTISYMNSDVTLSYSGSLLTGDQNIPLTGGMNSFSFVSNPYVSQVDFNSLASNGLYGGYWYLDPTVLDSTFENYNYFGSDIGTSNIYVKSASQYLQPGQAFFVCSNTSGTPTLKFTESAKNNDNTQVALFGTNKPLNRIATGLFANGKNLDGAVSVFNAKFTNAIGQEDGLKISNQGENITFGVAGKELCANGWSLPTDKDVLPIHFFNLRANKVYDLELDASQFNGNGLNAYLKDNLLGTQTLLAGNSNIVEFITTTDTAKYSSRYSIVFGTSTLPLNNIALTATLLSNSQVSIKWNVIGERNISNYKVERSTNGTTFIDLATVSAASESYYSFLDSSTSEGGSYYRIKVTDNTGLVSYSKVAEVSTVNHLQLTVAPNPITEGR